MIESHICAGVMYSILIVALFRDFRTKLTFASRFNSPVDGGEDSDDVMLIDIINQSCLV